MFKDSKLLANINLVGKPEKYTTIPDPKTWNIDKDGAYFAYCDNETIYGVEFKDFPFELIPEEMPLVGDMSSNFLTKPVDVSKYGVIFAAAQKNLAPSQLCVNIVRKDLIGTREKTGCPSFQSWKKNFDSPSKTLNTPCVFAVYIAGLNLKYMKEQGGLAQI